MNDIKYDKDILEGAFNKIKRWEGNPDEPDDVGLLWYLFGYNEEME